MQAQKETNTNERAIASQDSTNTNRKIPLQSTPEPKELTPCDSDSKNRLTSMSNPGYIILWAARDKPLAQFCWPLGYESKSDFKRRTYGFRIAHSLI